VSQWADARRKLGGKTNALPGDWETDFNPMMREVMDCCSDPLVSEVTFVGPRQVGKTSSLSENVTGYYTDYDPAQIGVFFENQDKADNWSKTRLMEMFRVSPALQDKIATGKGPSSANTVNYKDIPGGFIVILSAGSDANVASYSLRIVICEEMSKYSKTKLGDTYKRIRALTTTFFNSKIINVTTPTAWYLDEQGNIPENIEACRGTERYLLSDQRIPIMTCPHCGYEQQMIEEHFNFRDPGYKGTTIDEVWYNCQNPKCAIGQVRELHKPRIIQTGKWVAQKPFKGHAGFAHYPALWSPWVSWYKYGNEYLSAKRQPDTFQTFINEWRGEPFDPQMLVDKDAAVYVKRCEDYQSVPGPAVLLTCGVDIQGDRIEAEVKAWTPDRESFGMAFRIFYGKPHLLTDQRKLPEVWQQLDAFLQQTWVHEYGPVLGLDYVLIDQGFLLDEVQKFCKPRRGRHIHPCRGMSNVAHELVGRANKNNRMKVNYFPLGPNRAKAIIFANAELEEPGPGYMHWTKKGNYDDQYFKQLFLSERVTGIVGGVQIYDKITTSSRNEALDLNVYNLAAFELARPMLPIRAAQIAEAKKQWEKERGLEVKAEEKQAARPVPRRGGGWMGGLNS